MLALVTDAFGGRGGIAQAARDVIGAVAAQKSTTSVEVLPRHAPDPAGALPLKVSQHPPLPGRIGYAARAIAIVIRYRPDIIFCNHLFMAPLAALAARTTGAKLLVQLHGVEIWSPPTWPQRSALESANLLMCVSRDTRARLLAHVEAPPERAVVVNNTVGCQFTPGDRAAARAQFGLENELVMLSVGRLDGRERYKGHDRVISAMGGLNAPAGRSLLYLIAGDGDDRARLEHLADQAQLSKHVRFLGQVAAPDLPDLYRAADLFVLPSSGEGFGIVFLESMACGTPALGLRAGGAPDALADGELGGCATDIEFSAALDQALRRAEADRRGLPAKVRSRHGRDAFAARIAHVLTILH